MRVKMCYFVVFQPSKRKSAHINDIFLQESDKSQIFYWSSQTALGSGGCFLFDWLIVTMLKNLKTALFQTFSTWHRILSAFTALYWPSTAFYWPSTTKYQPVPPYTDPVPSWINHYRLILIQCHQVPTSRATYWPSTIMYQPVSPSSDPVPPSTEQYRLLLNQYHHISTSTAPYWPSTTKYQSIPTYTDPVPSYINQYRLLLTQYHQVPTSTTPYWPGTTKYQPFPTYTVVAWGLQTPAQFTPGLVSIHFQTFWIAPLPCYYNMCHPVHELFQFHFCHIAAYNVKYVHYNMQFCVYV